MAGLKKGLQNLSKEAQGFLKQLDKIKKRTQGTITSNTNLSTSESAQRLNTQMADRRIGL